MLTFIFLTGFPAGATGGFGGRVVEELFRLGWTGFKAACVPLSMRLQREGIYASCFAFWNGALECVRIRGGFFFFLMVFFFFFFLFLLLLVLEGFVLVWA